MRIQATRHYSMVLEHGTYSQKINQSNNLAAMTKPWQRAKFVTNNQHGKTAS